MSGKSPRSTAAKKSGKSLEAKRADKKAKAVRKSEVESTFEPKRRRQAPQALTYSRKLLSGNDVRW